MNYNSLVRGNPTPFIKIKHTHSQFQPFNLRNLFFRNATHQGNDEYTQLPTAATGKASEANHVPINDTSWEGIKKKRQAPVY